MREEEETLIYYISPTNKIHSNQCRHFKADTDGWQKMSSYSEAISTGAKPCQICCSQISVSPIETTNKQQDLLTQPVTDFSKSSSQEDVKTSGKKNKRSIACSITSFNTTEKLKTTSTQQDLFTQPVTKQPQSSSQNDVKTSKKKSKNKKKTPAKRYKILAGNGCHQAISEVQGILVPPIDDESSYQLILPDGLALEATFSNPYLESLALKQPNILGVHWFRGYPKMQDTKLVSFQIVGWDGNMPTNEQGWERWEFIGLWTLQKNLTVQRSITARTVRKEARQTGFITEFKFTFSNTEDWIQEKKLWIGYVYKLLCCREEDTLKIQKVIPYACPRVKPVPKPKPVNKKSKHITLIENLQRVDLNPVEETEAVLELLSIQLNLGVEEIVSLLYRIRSDVLKENQITTL
nr:hypothetical protein [Cyanobacterium sp. IPPAS B-1200]